jgi:RNA polymerase sigma-70 factor (ECF subfamily)
MESASTDWSGRVEAMVPVRDGGFVTTHWSAVVAAGGELEPDTRRALEFLCATYWYPLYVYVRRQGHDSEEAKDLTQEFFRELLERRTLRFADRTRGRFRTFLLTALKHFLVNDWKKANRRKRGGGLQLLPLGSEATETRFCAEPTDDMPPDQAFARRWATLVLGRVLDRLEVEFVAAGRGRLFAALKTYLTGEGSEEGQAAIARRLGMTEGNVKVSVHRLRRRYRELLRREIAMTVEDPKAVDEEILELFAALND